MGRGGGDNGKRKRFDSDLDSDSEDSYENNPFTNCAVPDPSQNAHSSCTETELRSSGHDPRKVLALLSAFLGLFSYDSKESQASGGGDAVKDPKTTLTQVATLLGLSASAPNGRALRKYDEVEEEEEDNVYRYRRRSKRSKITPNSDANATPTRQESIPDSSFCSTPPPKFNNGLVPGDSPNSTISSASVDCGKFRLKPPTTNADIRQNNLVILHQHVEHDPSVQVAFDSVRATLEPILLQKVTRVTTGDKLTVDYGHETAALIDLLRLLNASNPFLKDIGERTRKGAMLLEEGQNKVNEGKNILFSAISEIPKQIK